ncbi:MAG: class B sortase [Oscillospiraceae bacterium]
MFAKGKTSLIAIFMTAVVLVTSLTVTAFAEGGLSSGSSAEKTSETSTKTEASVDELATAKPKAYVAKTTGWEDIAAWKAVNSDVVGWLKIPNTNINHAVVMGATTSYYMALDYYKKPSRNGVIWADSKVKTGKRTELSKNTVLYGHNWTNYAAPLQITRASDVMFGQLPSYHFIEFAQTHPYIYYSTEAEQMTWQVFAVFYTEDSFNYIAANPSDALLQKIIDEAKSRSLHDFDVEVTAKDKILTLSTCTRIYGRRDDQRFVVMAKLLPADQKLASVTVTPNTDFKPPQFKY